MLPCRLWADLCGSRLVGFGSATPGDAEHYPHSQERVRGCVDQDNTTINCTVDLPLLHFPEIEKRGQMLHKDSFVPCEQPCTPFISLSLSLPASFLVPIPPRSSLVNGNTC